MSTFGYLDTSKTSTGVGKEEAKETLVNLLAKHISDNSGIPENRQVQKEEPSAPPRGADGPIAQAPVPVPLLRDVGQRPLSFSINPPWGFFSGSGSC